jgi:rare lipoprotein A
MQKLIILLIFICSSNIYAKTKYKSHAMIGIASYYGDPQKDDYDLMANGKEFDPNNPTIAAHHILPLGTKLKVLNLRNKKSICVIVTDRMPKNNRIIDLSYAGAKKLHILTIGVTKVKLTILSNKEFYSKSCNSNKSIIS